MRVSRPIPSPVLSRGMGTQRVSGTPVRGVTTECPPLAPGSVVGPQTHGVVSRRGGARRLDGGVKGGVSGGTEDGSGG